MILTMRITSKGQVTIPKAVRDTAGLYPGTDVEFVIEDGKVIVRRSEGQPTAGEEFVAHLERAGRSYTMTTEEVMALTRGDD